MSELPAQSDLACDRLLRWLDERRVVLFLLLAAAYLLGFNGQWRVEPDSALYLSIGQNLAEGKGYSYQGQTNRLAYPLLPLLIGGVFKLTGSSQVWPVLLVMLACGGACLALVYRLFWLHSGRSVAVLITLGVGVTALFYRYPYQVRNDMLFALGSMAVLCGWEARRRVTDSRRVGRWHDWVLLVGGLGVAIVSRPAMYALVVAWVIALGVWQVRARHWWWASLVPLGVGLLGVALWWADPRRGQGVDAYEEFILEQASSVQALAGRVGANLSALGDEAAVGLFGVPPGTYLNNAASLFMLALAVLLVRRHVLWGLYVLTTLAMMLLVLPKERYLLPLLPLTTFAWWRFLVWLNHRLPAWLAGKTFALLFVLALLPNMVRLGGYLIEQRMIPFHQYFQEGRWAPALKLAREMRRSLPADALVIAPPKQSRVYTYLARRTVVEEGEGLRLSGGPMYLIGPIGESAHAWLEGHGLGASQRISEVTAAGHRAELWRLGPAEAQTPEPATAPVNDRP